MSRPNLFSLSLWDEHVQCILEIFQQALYRLRDINKLFKDENEINRKLLSLLRRVNHELTNQGKGTKSPIIYEVYNQPLNTDEEKVVRESKRPDFQCGLVDSQFGKDLFFVIECKRLGNPTSNTWILNKNYVKNGIARFENPDWGYGADCESGAMVGYIQSMEHDVILTQVNEYLLESNISPINRIGQSWRVNGTTRLEHSFTRRIRPSPFLIHHLWVDLR